MKKKNKKPTASKIHTLESRIYRKMDIAVATLCLFGMVAGAIGIYLSGADYRQAEDEYNRIGQYVQAKESIKEVELSLKEEGEIKTDISDRMFDIDWESLRMINPEIVGWIVIEDTPVHYPIVQTVDNAKYLHTSFEGTDNSCGTIFLDTYNHSDFSDWNSLIYGHNMKNGSMFAVLNKYKDPLFYEEHKNVWLLTPYWERKYQIISAHPAQDGSETYSIMFPEGAYSAHVASEVSQSSYDTGNGYNTEMPMITLSTCTGRGLLDRFVLICQPIYETRLNPFLVDEGVEEGVENSADVSSDT